MLSLNLHQEGFNAQKLKDIAYPRLPSTITSRCLERQLSPRKKHFRLMHSISAPNKIYSIQFNVETHN